jgi:two-component system CheB/CheR fusion protein
MTLPMTIRKSPRKSVAPPASSPEERVPIVGVGASAGGYEAFRQLLKGLPPDPGLSFVFIQHLDPEHESMLTRLLAKATNLPVTEVKEGMRVERNHVYVIPPNTIMEIAHGVLHLAARKESAARNLPVDQFLKSLAEDEGSRAIGVILSGTASDGTLGLKAIKAEGGITFAQDEKSAAHDGMPRSAIASGCVDFILSPEEIARELARIGRHPYLAVHPRIKVSDRAAEANEDLRKIFRMLRTATGVDFTYYKYNTIMRRINRRMLVQKIEELPKYISLLEHDRHELEALYEDILIHVTAFFREPDAFQELKETFFPKVLGKKSPGEPVRVWGPGAPPVRKLIRSRSYCWSTWATGPRLAPYRSSARISASRPSKKRAPASTPKAI